MLCWKWLYHPLPYFVATSISVATITGGRPYLLAAGGSRQHCPTGFAPKRAHLKQARAVSYSF